MMTLLEEIIARVPADVRASKDCETIAAAVSVGRTRPNGREVGNGLVLDVLGIEVGNVVLDLVRDTTELRHILPLLAQGRLDVSSALVGEWFDALVTARKITREQADKVLALGIEPAPITEYEARCACTAPNGEWLA